jgi:hypothetical protein
VEKVSGPFQICDVIMLLWETQAKEHSGDAALFQS